jgi:hypothetical protein
MSPVVVWLVLDPEQVDADGAEDAGQDPSETLVTWSGLTGSVGSERGVTGSPAMSARISVSWKRR